MTPEATAKPRFKYSVQVRTVPGLGVFVLAESIQVWLKDPVYAHLVPLLDGETSAEQIFAILSVEHPPQRIFAALDHLRTEGWLADAELAWPSDQAAFWERDGVDLAAVSPRLTDTPVEVRALGGLDAAPVVEMLTASRAVTGPGGVLVVLTPDYLSPELDALNASALAEQRRWLLARPVGPEIWLGPAFAPPDTACWRCLAQRLRGHRKLEIWLESHGQTDVGLPRAALPGTVALAQAMVATEVTRWIVGGASTLTDTVLSVDCRDWRQARHPLTRRPQCRACGRSTPRAARPIELSPHPKRFTRDGGHRSGSPEALLARMGHHVSPITGIISRVDAGVTSSALTPIFITDHSFSDMHDDRYFLLEGVRRRAGGKGVELAQARASAIGESLERYSGVHSGQEPRRRGRLTDFAGAALHPNVCMGFSRAQYAARATINVEASKARWVPEVFDPAAEIEWSPLWSLTHQTERWLPTAWCYYGYPSGDRVFARAHSNGCAAGATPEEAILQGFLELVERDHVALWWYNRVRRPGVDLAAVDHPYPRALVAHYQTLGRALWALDLTADLGIPVYAAISRRLAGEADDVILGFGAHLDPQVALLRALTEVNQSLPAVPGPGRDGYLGSADAVAWWRSVTIATDPWLAADPALPITDLGRAPSLAGDDLRADVLTCVERAARHGMETLVLDQTRPDVGLPVVKVVVPGLRHFWARFGPGRLYDVPVALRWLSRPTTEAKLNPYVVYF